MNLYEVSAQTRVGLPTTTHYKNEPVLHVSAKSVEVAARQGHSRALRWARREHKWFIKASAKPFLVPVVAVVTAVKLLDPDWNL